VHILLRVGDAELGRRRGELRAGAGQAHVAGHGEREPGAISRTFDHRDGRDRCIAQAIEAGADVEAEAAARVLVGRELAEVGHVRAGAERASGQAAQDQHARAVRHCLVDRIA
jgi:hypothetical protein